MPSTGNQQQRDANALAIRQIKDEMQYAMSDQDWLSALECCMAGVRLCEDWTDLEHELIYFYTYLVTCCLANGLVQQAGEAQATLDELRRQ